MMEKGRRSLALCAAPPSLLSSVIFPFKKVWGVGDFLKIPHGVPSNSHLFSQSKMQIKPPAPSLMMRSKVSDSLVRDSSGMCASLACKPSPTSS